MLTGNDNRIQLIRSGSALSTAAGVAAATAQGRHLGGLTDWGRNGEWHTHGAVECHAGQCDPVPPETQPVGRSCRGHQVDALRRFFTFGENGAVPHGAVYRGRDLWRGTARPARHSGRVEIAPEPTRGMKPNFYINEEPEADPEPPRAVVDGSEDWVTPYDRQQWLAARNSPFASATLGNAEHDADELRQVPDMRLRSCAIASLHRAKCPNELLAHAVEMRKRHIQSIDLQSQLAAIIVDACSRDEDLEREVLADCQARGMAPTDPLAWLGRGRPPQKLPHGYSRAFFDAAVGAYLVLEPLGYAHRRARGVCTEVLWQALLRCSAALRHPDASPAALEAAASMVNTAVEWRLADRSELTGLDPAWDRLCREWGFEAIDSCGLASLDGGN
eukprot:Polyplicarium_translucidae@DN1727_c0_g1_i1.p1